ncbi:hypothetical protein [Veillonella magna]|uniref:Transcriptional regulator n=1 Tax=Veillonella magna TaxID=464322 RepID=A0ABS2GGG7_9FIRM|nr:hypothetical protein [Veillonella magna]MBM6824277.1 hypothetical protein [Veillonella magna]MBM6912617.1 hypothetical protein [Veillonella magna]
MNFIEEFKKFENWLLVHPNVSPSARLVWHSLLHYNNLCGWKEEFDLSMSALQLSTGLSAPTIRKAREQLRLMGRIAYRKGSMDHSAVYRLSPLASFGAASSAKERAMDETAGKDDSERTTQRAHESSDTRTNEGTNESTAEGTNTRIDKEADTRTDERACESVSETKDERPKETAMESTIESTMERPMESTMESTTESTMESPMERTEEKSDATFLAKPKQDNTRQSISKESVKKGSDGVLEQPTNEDAVVEQPTNREATVEQPTKVTSVVPLVNENSKQPTDKSSKQPTDKSSTQSADEDKPFVPPTIEMVRDYCKEKGYHVDPEIFMAYYDSKGWVVGKGPMKSWTRAVAYWEHLDKKRAAEAKERQRRYRQHSYGTKTDSYRTNGQGQTSSSVPVRKYHYE